MSTAKPFPSHLNPLLSRGYESNSLIRILEKKGFFDKKSSKSEILTNLLLNHIYSWWCICGLGVTVGSHYSFDRGYC
jgi:hypothetical protein